MCQFRFNNNPAFRFIKHFHYFCRFTVTLPNINNVKKHLILILLLCPLLLIGESFNIKKIGMDEGLSNSFIVGISQDRNGYIWFATESGLNRFDGHNFRIYKKNQGLSTGVNSNELNQVLADNDGKTVWIATQRTGLNAFDTKTEKFTYFLNNQKDPSSIVTNDITNLTQASDGNLWLCTYHWGVDYYNKQTGKFTHYNQSNVPGLVSNHVWSIADDKHGKLFIGHVFDGLSVLSYKDRKIKHYNFNPKDPNSLPGVEVLCIHIDKRNNVWLGTNNGLALFNQVTEKFTVYRNTPRNPGSLSANRILSISEFTDGKLWIGVNQGGINILDIQKQPLSTPEKVTFQHIEANDDESGLSHKTVKVVYQDSYKNIWIGTLGGGINVISNKKRFFNTLVYSPLRSAKNSLSNKVASGICTDLNDRIWVGTDGGGIDVFENDLKTGHFGSDKGNLSDNFIVSAMKDSEGNLWFGSGGNNVYKYNPESKRFNQISAINSRTGIRCFFEDKDKTIWIGTNSGLFTYHIPTGKVNYYTMDNSQLPDNLILSVSQDKYGKIWVGTFGQGLVIFAPNFKLETRFYVQNGFCSNAIHHIYKDSRNRMWIATREGLVLFNNSSDKHYRIFSQKDGMSDSYVCSIAEASPDNIWFSSNSGISNLNVNISKFINFDYHDGVPRGNFMLGTVAKTKTGIIYFGSQSGICYFNANQNLLTDKTLPATITEFRYFDQRSSQPNGFTLPTADKIELEYHQNTFSISFNVPDFGLTDKTEYSYKLKGFVNSWYDLRNGKQVTFRNIPYGTYQFMLKSRLRNQEWSESITTLEINVAPPFWLTWWAKAFYGILVVLLILYVIRFYKRRLDLENSLYLEQKNHLQEQELNNERMSFYTNIAHELRTPLTLIIGPLEDLESDKTLTAVHSKKISLIYNSATRLLNLINQILEFRKTESRNRKLSVIKDDLSALVKEIGIKYEGLNLNKNVKFQITIETEVTHIYFDPEIITIVLDNLISNAMKYTKKGEIAISMRDSNRNENLFTEIEVRDTGVGISSEFLNRIFENYYQVRNEHKVSGSGIGLSLVKNLAELHQGKIEVESKLGEGSALKFSILTNNQYVNEIHDNEIHEDETKVIEQISIHEDNKGLILIVEDNDEIREYAASCFLDTFEVLEATNGKEGVDLAIKRIPDIILSDIMMPLMDGIELCKILKEDMRTSHIPLILLTAKDTMPDKTEGYTSGADSYITKPFSTALLQSRVNNLLESRKKMSALFTSPLSQKQTIVTESLNKIDKEFIAKVTKVIEQNLDSEQINISYIADQMNMSHSTLYRKIKALTSISINEFIRKIKIQNAEKLLLTGKYTVSEISFMIGINSPSYFRQCFKDEFGLAPTDYLKHIMENKGG